MSSRKILNYYNEKFKKTGGKLTGTLKAEVDKLPLSTKRKVLELARKHVVLSHKGEGLTDTEKAFRTGYNREKLIRDVAKRQTKNQERKQKLSFEKELDRKAIKISGALGKLVARSKKRRELEEMKNPENTFESTATGTLLPGAGEAWKYAKAGAKNDWDSIKGDIKKGMPGFKKDLKKRIKSVKKTGKQALNWAKSKVFQEQFISAIVNKDYMLAEKLFNEHMEAIAEMRVKVKKQVVASKIGQTPFKGASMKHYKKQIRAAVRKMKAQTKIVDGPEKTVRHVHEENLNEVSKEKLAKYIKKSNQDSRTSKYIQGHLAGENPPWGNEREKKFFGDISDKRSKGVNLAVDKLTGKAKVAATDKPSRKRKKKENWGNYVDPGKAGPPRNPYGER